MTVTVDLDVSQAAAGIRVPLLSEQRVRREAVTSEPVAGFDGIRAAELVADVLAFRGTNSPGVTVLVEMSAHGDSWETAHEFTFTGTGTASFSLDAPEDRFRVVCTPGGGLREAVVSVVCVPKFVDEAGGGGNGGSQPVQMTSVQINSAELKALTVTPKVLLAAAGGRNYHIIHGVVLHYRFGTTPYTGEFVPTYGFGSTIDDLHTDQFDTTYGLGSQLEMIGGGDPANTPASSGLLSYDSDAYLYAVGPNVFAGRSWNMWSADRIEDKPLALANFPAAANATVAAIADLNQGAQTFTVAGDHTDAFAASGKLFVSGSSGNDGTYNVVSVTLDGGDTVIEVFQAIPDETADGDVLSGAVADGDGTVTVRVWYSTIDGTP